MKRFFSPVTNFLKNLWRYRFILWRDRNWDSLYLIDLLIAKLEWMENNFREESIIVWGEKYAAEMAEARYKLVQIRDFDDWRERWYTARNMTHLQAIPYSKEIYDAYIEECREAFEFVAEHFLAWSW